MRVIRFVVRAISTGSATRVGGGSAGVNGVSDGQKAARLQHDALDARQPNEEDHAKEDEDDDADEHVTPVVGRDLHCSMLIS